MARAGRQGIVWSGDDVVPEPNVASPGNVGVGPANDNMLTHWGLVTPYGDVDLGQHWLRQWLVAWRHQAITWTNVDLSSDKSHDIQLRALS